MNNLLIVWREEERIGVPIIDEQHHGLATLVNSLFYSMGNKHAKELLLSTISAFELYSKIHFEIEEYTLRKTNFPDLEKHARAHEKMQQQLHNIFIESKTTGDPTNLVDYFKKTWLGHVYNFDRHYVEHVQDYLKKHSL